MEKFINKIICGNALTELRKLPDKLVDMCVTSPPYWALRDYGIKGQLGLEKTFDKYIKKLCNIFDEVRRVLKNKGTCWVNLGDSYNSSQAEVGRKDKSKYGGKSGMYCLRGGVTDYPSKCLAMVPFRFAIEMVNRGWILRNTIIWYKPNCMPSSVKDRFTVDFEYLFFFSKQKRYYFGQQFEEYSDDRPLNPETKEQRKSRGTWDGSNRGIKMNSGGRSLGTLGGNPIGRNKRCVWTIPTRPFKEAHFAVFPEKLIETPIKAGCPKYICKKCGKTRRKIYKHKVLERYNLSKDDPRYRPMRYKGKYEQGMRYAKNVYKGYTSCNCNAGFKSGIVLDPFMGSGTTAVVARKLGRNYLGIELSPDYVKMANKRLEQAVFGI